MAVLDITRSYSDGEVFFEADLDAIKDEIETFFNTTGVGDDNIQTSGITGSTKIADNTITTAKIADEAVTAVKIVDSGITTAKISDGTIEAEKVALGAVTPAKTATLVSRATEGMTITFHTFNDTLDIPRGWMRCNGEVVNETNYNAEHGSGAYAADGIASSNLLNKYLPNMTDKYAVGATSTTQDGTVAITTVGNAGSIIDFSHTHTIGSHTHGTLPLIYSGVERSGAIGAGSPVVVRYDALGNNTDTLASAGSATQDIRPESIQEIFIMKVI